MAADWVDRVLIVKVLLTSLVGIASLLAVIIEHWPKQNFFNKKRTSKLGPYVQVTLIGAFLAAVYTVYSDIDQAEKDYVQSQSDEARFRTSLDRLEGITGELGSARSDIKAQSEEVCVQYTDNIGKLQDMSSGLERVSHTLVASSKQSQRILGQVYQVTMPIEQALLTTRVTMKRPAFLGSSEAVSFCARLRCAKTHALDYNEDSTALGSFAISSINYKKLEEASKSDTQLDSLRGIIAGYDLAVVFNDIAGKEVYRYQQFCDTCLTRLDVFPDHIEMRFSVPATLRIYRVVKQEEPLSVLSLSHLRPVAMQSLANLYYMGAGDHVTRFPHQYFEDCTLHHLNMSLPNGYDLWFGEGETLGRGALSSTKFPIIGNVFEHLEKRNPND